MENQIKNQMKDEKIYRLLGALVALSSVAVGVWLSIYLVQTIFAPNEAIVIDWAPLTAFAIGALSALVGVWFGKKYVGM